jgi:dicarboxylate/amino acid:cation (Na+ or H+) symporter, DAACS family
MHATWQGMCRGYLLVEPPRDVLGAPHTVRRSHRDENAPTAPIASESAAARTREGPGADASRVPSSRVTCRLRARMSKYGQRFMIGGVLAGAVLGIFVNVFLPGVGPVDWFIDNIAETIGQLFLRLLFMLVVPLLFSALVVGIAELDMMQLGRIGLKMLAYTVVVSGIAVLIGLALVNIVGPGRGAPDSIRELARESSSVQAAPAPEGEDAADLIVAIIPRNPIDAAANGDMIGLIVFSLLFGIALSFTRTEGTAVVRTFIQGIYDLMMKLIDGVLTLAPIGVGALIFVMMARLGADLLAQLAAYVAVVIGGLAIHMFVVYSATVWVIGGKNPIEFFSQVRVAALTAFSTASSSATLPTALKVADEKLKLPSHVSRFVLTAGSAMNQNGTALFEGVTVIFIAQLYGVPLGIGQQAFIMVICVLAGIGTAGVPAGSIPVIAMILAKFQIPVEGLGLILGIDRILDMCRTTLNVVGDLAAAVCVARGEKPLPSDVDAAIPPAPETTEGESETAPAIGAETPPAAGVETAPSDR